jgi:serine/threonine-protein kinase RsbW
MPRQQSTLQGHWHEARLRSAARAGPLLDRLEAAMAARGYPQQDRFAVRLALEEAVANAVQHGHGGDPSKEVRVRCRVTSAQVLAEVEDEGPGFDPTWVPDPTAPENLGKPRGRGLLLMRSYLTRVRFSGPGNRVTLCKRRSGRP